MIQQISESEKNRIRNLHIEHFILNENKGDYPDIPGFKKFIFTGVLTYTKDLGRGDEIILQYSDSQGFDIDSGERPIPKEIHKELSKHGNVEVKGLQNFGGNMLVVPKVKNITNLLNGLKPILTKLYK